MPKKYPKQQRIDALMYLTMHENINTVHQLTGVHPRTLRRWRAELRKKQNRGMSEKTFLTDTKWSQNHENGHKTLQSGHITSQSGHNQDINSEYGHTRDTKIDQISENGHKDHTNDENRGVPGKTYPYPLEEDELTNTDQFEDFKQLRATLMEHAKQLAAALNTTDEDINLRTLALARILDRIAQLDRIIPRLNPNQVIRIEYVYDGAVHNVPPWKGASQIDKT